MQSNTVEVENQSINCLNFSVENMTYKSDPFTIRDGRYVGSDGFVISRDFEEFYQRFPDYVRKWVSKHADRSAPKQDVEDWTQDLLIHPQHLPETSKHREASMNDIVQTFDPVKHYGANEARFRNYINLCLTNKFRSIHSKRMKDVLCHPGNPSLDGQAEGEESRFVDDEYCHLHSAYLRQGAKASEKEACDRAFLEEFMNFVRREDPLVLPNLQALPATGTLGAAVDWLGITESEFGRMRGRLGQLAKCFQTREQWPGERRPYKKRVVRSKGFSGPHPN